MWTRALLHASFTLWHGGLVLAHLLKGAQFLDRAGGACRERWGESGSGGGGGAVKWEERVYYPSLPLPSQLFPSPQLAFFVTCFCCERILGFPNMAEVGSFVDVESAVQHFRTLSGGFFLTCYLLSPSLTLSSSLSPCFPVKVCWPRQGSYQLAAALSASFDLFGCEAVPSHSPPLAPFPLGGHLF